MTDERKLSARVSPPLSFDNEKLIVIKYFQIWKGFKFFFVFLVEIK